MGDFSEIGVQNDLIFREMVVFLKISTKNRLIPSQETGIGVDFLK